MPTNAKICDWCEKPRCDVQPYGEETSACFLCRQESRRQRLFDVKLGRYVAVDAAVAAIAAYPRRGRLPVQIKFSRKP